MNEVSFEDFAKLDIRIGTVVAAERVPDTDKLLKCTVDFGGMPEGIGIRTIVSGVAEWKAPEDIIGKQFPYIVNLAPRIIRGVESQGMLLAVRDEAGVALLAPERAVVNGAHVQ
ncbi:MAG TPA: hypothetical protein VJH33_03610 [Candidatus Paceibacterota bacterium]